MQALDAARGHVPPRRRALPLLGGVFLLALAAAGAGTGAGVTAVAAAGPAHAGCCAAKGSGRCTPC